MKDWIKDYFTFNRNEQRGLAILLGLMLCSLLFSIFSPSLVRHKEYDYSAFKAQVEKFMADTVETVNGRENQPEGNHSGSPGPMPQPLHDFLSDPFTFDPNTLEESEWAKTGLNSKVIRNIIRYREKGGTFRTREDFRKIYGMTDSAFAILEPYIIIHYEKPQEPVPWQKGNSKEQPAGDPGKSESDIILQVELNTADSAALTALPGIGPSFASRIIKYRNMLGGYVHVEQLLEVKGMDSIRFSGIKNNITADASRVKKMDLNAVSFKEMARHPYFEYYLVKIIFSYRDRIKSYDSVGQLRNVENIYPELYDKIAPYLEVKPKADN